MMQVAQITDLHLRPGETGRVNDERLACVVDRLLEILPDLVLVTGDLTEDGDLESYHKVKAQLARLPMPVLPAIGNHDLRHNFTTVFDETPTDGEFIHYAASFGELRVVVLDTTDEGRHSGSFCARRAAWLDARLAEAADEPTLIALHHPPLKSGVGWMDTNSDGPWSQRLAEVIRRHPQVIALVCGHIHRPFASSFVGRPTVVSPSTALPLALELDPINVRKPDHRPLIVDEPPGYTLHLWNGALLVSHFASARPAPVIVRFDEQADFVEMLRAEPPLP